MLMEMQQMQTQMQQLQQRIMMSASPVAPRSPAQIARAEAQWAQERQEMLRKAKLMGASSTKGRSRWIVPSALGNKDQFNPHGRYKIAVDSLGILKAVPIGRAIACFGAGPFGYTMFEDGPDD
jgi:hypothetical protein